MGNKAQPLSAAAQKVLDRVQKVCDRLPGTAMEIDGFGHRSFRVGKKTFVMLGQSEQTGDASLSIKSDLATQDSLIRQGGYHRTPYIGQHGWVSLDSNRKPDWKEVEELIVDAYRRVAPKRLLAQLDD